MASTSLQDKMKLAAGSFAANDFESALNSFQECLTLTTNEKALRIIQTNIGATFQRMSRFDDALKAFDSALSYDDTYLQALFNKGVTLKALNKFNEALETFNKVLASNRTYFPALCGKCEVLCSLNQFDDALEAANVALEVEPNNPVGYDDRAFVYLKLKKFQLAIDDYIKFEEDCSKIQNAEKKRLLTIAMTYRGHELGREGKIGEAIQMFKDVLKFAPNEDRRFALAVLLYKDEKRDEAEIEFKAVLKVNDNHLKSCAALGTILCEKGQYTEATTLLRKAYVGKEFDLFGKGPLMQNLAVSLVKGGKLEEGKQIFKELVEAEPTNEIAKQALKSLNGSSINAIKKVVEESNNQVEEAKKDLVVKEKSDAEVLTKKVVAPPPAPENAIKMKKPEINVTTTAVEDRTRVSVVKRKSGRRSIIAEDYLEKVENSHKSIVVNKEPGEHGEKKVAPETIPQEIVEENNLNINDNNEQQNNMDNTSDKKNTATPSSPSSGLIYSVEQLQIGKCPQGIDMTRREQYLSDADFEATFGMSKDTFLALPKWKRQRAKREVGLF
jgi:tetratricopeptide (TPR) repeat protein